MNEAFKKAVDKASELLAKREILNECNFHDVDRLCIIEAMMDYAEYCLNGKLSQLNKKPQTLTSLWGLMKDRTCTNSCSVVCGECQLPISSQTEIVNESWEGCDGCTEQDEVMYKNGYVKGYNAAIAELPKEISDEEIKEFTKNKSIFKEDMYRTYFIMGANWYREQLNLRK